MNFLINSAEWTIRMGDAEMRTFAGSIENGVVVA